MRAPTETRDHKTAHYLATVAELEAYADRTGFGGASTFYAWERLNLLVGRLQGHYDHFELEGDAAPVRREIESYQSDMALLKAKPDPWVVGRLNELLGCLEEGVTDITILTSTIPAAPSGNWPQGYLAIKPEDLEALLKDRSAQG